MTMKRTNIHLSNEQRDWLRQHSYVARKTPAAIVRDAIEKYRKAAEKRNDWRAKALTRERSTDANNPPGAGDESRGAAGLRRVTD